MRGPTDRGHRHAAEQERQQAAEQQPDNHIGIGQREADLSDAEIEVAFHRLTNEIGQILGIGRKKDQCPQPGRPDGITLGHGLCGVAHSVERVGVLAHFVGKASHFGNAAGIIGHRPEGIERNDHAGQGQHGDHSNPDAEQAGQ